MKKDETLEKLRVLELNTLLQHLRFGKEHIIKYLSEKQFAELLKIHKMDDQQKNNLSADKAEKSGNFTLALNTLFTCIIGAWLGVAGFLGTGLGSKNFLLTITVIAAVSSAYLGYYSYKSVKQQAKDAIIDQKLHNIQLKIIKIINKKGRHQIEKIIDYLNQSFQSLAKNESFIKAYDEPMCKFESKEEILGWLNKLNNLLEKKAGKFPNEIIYQIYLEELADCKMRLKNILSKNIAFIENSTDQNCDHSSAKHKLTNFSWQLDEHANKASFIKALTDPTIAIPKTTPRKASWLRSNMVSLLIGFLPTVFGGFGSMFVYFGGIPNIAKEMGINSLEILAKHPIIKPIELIVALFITFYFGYTFALSNYKNFQREQELDATQKNITNEESTMIEINAKLNAIRKIKQQLARIMHIVSILEELSTSLLEKNKKLESYIKKADFLEKKIGMMQEKIIM